MKRTTYRQLSFSVLFLTAFLFLPNGVNAAWFTIHGNNGKVEYMSLVDNTEIYKGWGLHIDQSPGMYNWIHFTFPTTLQNTVRYIAFQLQTGSADAWVDEVHVYNGNTKIKTFSDLNWSGENNIYLLDLGSQMAVGLGFGISVKIAAGVETMSHNFRFHTLGADLY